MKRGDVNRRRKLEKCEAWAERKAYGSFKRADNPPTAAVESPSTTLGAKVPSLTGDATVRASVERVRATR